MKALMKTHVMTFTKFTRSVDLILRDFTDRTFKLLNFVEEEEGGGLLVATLT